MPRVRAAAVAAAIAAAAALGCAGAPRPKLAWPDAPVELRDDGDRQVASDHLWVMPAGPERARARTAIAAAIARRIDDALRDNRTFVAAELFDELLALWSGDVAAVHDGLAPHLALLRELRARFARAGALEPAARTLVALSEVDAAGRAGHLAELDELLAFADDLGIAENGPQAVRAEPISVLHGAVWALPVPWLVDRYVTLLIDRQRAVATALAHGGPGTMEVVRAHRDVLATSRRIAGALARAGRTRELHARLAEIKGVGVDRDLAARAEAVARRPSAEAYAELASVLRADDDAVPDPAGALAIGLEGLARYPGDPGLLVGAGGDARALGRTEQAIACYQQALRNAAEIDAAIALRLGQLYAEKITRLAGSGRPGAARAVWRSALRFTAAAAKQHPSVVWQQAAAVAESALGKGLASQGLIDDGRRALTASLERAPSTDAYETLTMIDVQVDRFGTAQRWADAGIALLGHTTTGDHYRRAKLEQLAADALRRAGKPRAAAVRYLQALRSWASLGDLKSLPPGIVAERLLDTGRALWWLGDAGRAIDLVGSAVDADPDSPEVAAGAVAFLIQAGRYREALDAYHRGLGQPNGAELFKVYMSLWILGDAHRRGEPPDAIARDYLAARKGDLWYELLARAATGSVPFDALRAVATTGPRRAELAFYGAVLGLDPAAATPDGRRKLLEQVVATRAVLDAEYDLARAYLAAP